MKTHMVLAIGFSLITAFPLQPAHRTAVPGRGEYRHALKFRRIPKHPKNIVTTTSASARTTATATPVYRDKIGAVMDNVAFFGAGFCAGQSTGGVANGPSALREAGLGEAVGNLGKLVCWEDLWFPAPEMYDFCPDAGLHSLKASVERAARAGAFALTIGGDHSVAAVRISLIARL